MSHYNICHIIQNLYVTLYRDIYHIISFIYVTSLYVTSYRDICHIIKLICHIIKKEGRIKNGYYTFDKLATASGYQKDKKVAIRSYKTLSEQEKQNLYLSETRVKNLYRPTSQRKVGKSQSFYQSCHSRAVESRDAA